jgi:cellulose synthase/poly-beta-1,6-N-acetylglucosamine synthase-like glycosyltransferase
MLAMVDIYFYFLTAIGCFILILIFIKNFSKPNFNIESPIGEVTVIIPFRNESANLKRLIGSFAQQSKLPQNILFVDDHSSDDSSSIISEYLKQNTNATLLHLPETLTGKKEAIRFAIRNVESAYCLSMDADIWFDQDFFDQMMVQEKVDMQIRPVVMKGSSLIGHFAGAEHSFFNALNKLLSPIYVLSSSGANLLFKKSAFDKLDNFESHRHIASGDDHFLLRDFQAGQAEISVSDAKKDLVFTESTNSMNDYFNQRIRWLGKTKLQATITELFIGLLIAIYLIGGLLTLIYLLFIGRFDLFLILFFGRWILDSLVFLNYTIPLKQSSHLLWLPFFQLIYPILFISVLLGSLFLKPQWKGRNT